MSGTKALPLLACLAVTFVAAGARVSAQPAPPPAFEVASVKPAAPNNRTRIQILAGGRMTATNMALTTLVSLAYDVREFQIAEAPGWMTSARWDISAKAENSSTTSPEMMLMLRTLLADRFKLALHQETRGGSVYELVVADSGLKLKASDADKSRSLDGGNGRAIGGKVTLPLLSQFLSMQLGRPVVDRTGVEGAYDIALTWSPDTTPDSPGPSIFTAVQEQLGLKLTTARGTLSFIVIDSVVKPSAN